jgi:hypothetical protein
MIAMHVISQRIGARDTVVRTTALAPIPAPPPVFVPSCPVVDHLAGQRDVDDGERRSQTYANTDCATAAADNREPVENPGSRRPVRIPGHQCGNR